MLTMLLKLKPTDGPFSGVRKTRRKTNEDGVDICEMSEKCGRSGSKDYEKSRDFSILTDTKLSQDSMDFVSLPFRNETSTAKSYVSKIVAMRNEISRRTPEADRCNTDRSEITCSVGTNNLSQNCCRFKSKFGLYWKIKRQFLQCFGNRVYPTTATGIEESDGGFFENLGTLLAERARAQTEAEGPLPEERKVEEEDEEGSENGSVEEPTEALLESDSDRDEEEHVRNLMVESVGWNIEELYTALVYLTQHQIGFDVTNECGQEALLNHLQQAFKVDDQMHERVLEEARNMEAPETHLNVEVIEAKELVSKDANGKSDPFCALYLESAPTRRYNTAVKTATLNPVWEEHFELPLIETVNDVLYLEVWDFDAAETVPEKMSKVKDVKGVRGLVKLAKEIAVTATTGSHDNEFIGRIQIPLKDIPVTGHTSWYSLEKKNKTKRRGVVRLRLAFSAEHNAQVAAQEHRHLLRILLLYELESEKVEKYCWSGRWSGPAEALILQHRAQRGLLTRNVSLAKWVEFSRVHQEYPLSFILFDKLALELLRPMDSGLFSNDEIRLFWEATKKLLHSCLNSIRKIRKLTVGDKNVFNQLAAILGTLSSVASLKIPEDFELFPPKMYGWLPEAEEEVNMDVMRALELTVVQGGVEWFDHILKNNSVEGEADEDTLKYHIRVIQLVRADLQRAIEYYDKLFIKKINFPYARTLYIMYEKRISDMCMIIVEDVCARLKRIEIDSRDEVELSLGTTLFELYLTLQRYAVLGRMLCTEGLDHMKIQSYHEWFMTGVAHWLDIAVYKALKRIDRAVEFDSLQPFDDMSQYSSSAVDTLSIFYQVKVFWTQLAWPDIEGSYTFIAKIIDDICKCSVEYADKMARKAEQVTQLEQLDNESGVYEKKFEVSDAWCYAINNIDYIRTSIGPLASDLGLQGIIDSLGENKTQQEADRCRETLQLIIDNATETVKDKILEMLEVVARKMAPAINRYLMEGAELIDTESNAMDRLMQYLDSNLITLRDNLNEDNFQRILLVIWETVAQMLYELVNNNLEKRRPPSFYSNLHRTLHSLISFFNPEADEAANLQVLERIEHLLKLHGLETAELIHQYNFERLKEQKEMEDAPYGQITIKAHFIDNSLMVQILNARNLKPMDSNGKCDSYIKVKLLPEEKFAQTKAPKTRVQKESLFPLFDESFNIPLTGEQRDTKDAILVFELKDKDFLRSRFMAEAFLPFSEIPETGPDRGLDSLEQVHLKLSRPTNKNTDVVRALGHRKGDSQATDFINRLNSKIDSR